MPNLDDAPREVANTVKSTATSVGSKTHPLVIIAAGAVTLFSAVGIAMMTGVIPSAHSGKSNSSTGSAMPVTAAAAGAASAGIGNVVDAPAQSTTSTKPIESGTMGKPLERAEQQAQQRAEADAAKAPSASAAKPPVVAAKPPAPKPAPQPSKPVTVAQAPTPSAMPGAATERTPSAPRLEEVPTPVYNQGATAGGNVVLKPDNVPVACLTCGTVDSISPVEQQGQGSGAGAVIGGVVGGVLGHQVGKGRGRDVATVAGAVGGAVLGNQIEKGAKTSRSYDIRVRMDNNTFQTVRSDVEPNVRVGDKVRVENGRVVR
jgi:outer membrane lipoprotein SlyB